MPKKQASLSKPPSQLLAILPPKPETDSEPTTFAESPVKAEQEVKPITRLRTKPVAVPAVDPPTETVAEPQAELQAEPVETPTDNPAQAPKKVVAVVPRKVQEAAALGIELEPPPEEIPIPENVIFQAVGIISGEIAFAEEVEGKVTATVTLQGKQYPLFYASQRRRAYAALKKEIEATGESTQRLVVYPKITHFPGRDQAPAVGFQLVGFDKGKELEAISTQLEDMEFRLCGLWQFIPVCRTPCVSVFKNFSRERLDFIKEIETVKKVKFMKASHLPLFWRDALVQPFRFNPKAPKEEQGRPAFVEVKAKFLPNRDTFAFESLLELPRDKPPKFLKASKDDKALAMSEKKARKEEREAAERAAERETKRLASGASAKPQPKPKPKTQPRVQSETH